MRKKSKQLTYNLIEILHSANVHISKTDLSTYSTRPNVTYIVSQNNVRKFDMSIEPKKFGISHYAVTTENGDKFSCYARPNAVFFHRSVANSMLEIYRTLKLRHLIQKTQTNVKK